MEKDQIFVREQERVFGRVWREEREEKNDIIINIIILYIISKDKKKCCFKGKNVVR